MPTNGSAGTDRRDTKDGPSGQQACLAGEIRLTTTRSSSTRNKGGSMGKDTGGAGITEKGFLGKAWMFQRKASVCAGWKVWEGHLGHGNRNSEYLRVNRHASLHNELPFLSPVSTQILMSAFASFEMVSGTPSWSLSSIAVAPNSWNKH